MADVNLFLAFGAGILSFISPCCLPLYPAFISYITSVSVEELRENNLLMNKRAMLHTLFFLLGFSIIFVVLGLSQSYIYTLFVQYNELIRQIGAILTIAFGLVVAGIITPKFLMQEKKFTFKNRPSGYLGSVLIGLGYAAGWTPCVGPILAVVMSLGISTGEGFSYMLAYTLGFSIPFFVMSFFIGKSNWIKKYSNKIVRVGGYIMIAMGIVLYFGWMTQITSFLTYYVFRGFTGF